MSEALSYATPSCLFCAEDCSPTYTVIDGEVHSLKRETELVRMILENPGTVSFTEEIDSIRNNLEVMFVLREILNYPSEKCLPYLSEHGGQMHPEHWFTTCSTCRLYIHECYRIRKSVTQLEKKLVEIKSTLKQSIFSSSQKPNGIKQEDLGNLNHSSNDIWNDLRNHVLQEDKVVEDDQKDIYIPAIDGYSDGFVFSDDYYQDACKNENSMIPSPALSNTPNDWCPDSDEVDYHKPKLQLKQATKRLKRAKGCKTAKRKEADNSLETVPQSSLDSQMNTQDGYDKVKQVRKRVRLYCDECSCIFQAASVLAKHKRQVHAKCSGEGFKCPECGEVFQILHKLCHHLNHKHRRKAERRTFKWISTDAPGVKKVYIKTGIPYYCDHCDVILPNRPRLTNHVKDYHGDRKHAECQYCEEKFESKQLLQFHFEMDHPNVPEVVNRITPKEEETPCPHCSESFPTKTETDYHIGKFHVNTCAKCSYKAESFQYLQKHLTTAHEIGEKPLVCELCSKRFFHIAGLNGHKKKVHYKELGLTPFMCNVCGYLSPTEVHLKAHVQAVHEKLRPYFCEICGKSFKVPGHLKGHLLLHQAKKEKDRKNLFPCKFCDAKFSTRQAVFVHKKQNHSDTFSFRCDNCGKGYCSSKTLTQHATSCMKTTN